MYVRVSVTPGARKERVTKNSDTECTISVREPAERNLANMRVRHVLAEMYGVRLSDVHLVSGHRSPRKIFDITGI